MVFFYLVFFKRMLEELPFLRIVKRIIAAF